jgi:hypothetical protein
LTKNLKKWKKKKFFFLNKKNLKKNSGKFLEALGSGIGTGSIFCLSLLLSNNVNAYNNNLSNI